MADDILTPDELLARMRKMAPGAYEAHPELVEQLARNMAATLAEPPDRPCYGCVTTGEIGGFICPMCGGSGRVTEGR